MKRSLKTILTASAVVVGLGAAAWAAGPGPGFGFGGGPCWGGGPGFMQTQGGGGGGPGMGGGPRQGMGPGSGMMGGGMMGGGMMGGPGWHMQQLDTNSDNAISTEEMETWRAERFTQFDADGDGQISEQEFRDAGPQGFGWRARNWDEMPANMQAMMQERRDFMFRGMDADDSGTVSQDEFTAHMGPGMQHMDANNDGQITADEMGPGMMRNRQAQ
ncbi:EF-hand domain-containing protein [Caenispirillum salinarum]|uniref:EF-hand domain-containing protein n=1 Tax=Caenispirillum salinarum TaxID=859058 RepID=UPI00384A82B9